MFKPMVSLFLLVLLLMAPLSFAQLSLTDVGKYDISGVPSGQEGLSGITWAGGSTYYAAEDSGGRLHKLTININSSTGGIIGSPTDDSQVGLNGRTDMEGVAYIGSGQVYVSDETGATITKYNVSGGSSTGSISVPDVYTAYRDNRSLESLTRQSNGASIWTANEEALYGTTNGGMSVDDGPEAGSTGTVVRLQKFDSSLSAVGQWAYQTDSTSGHRGVSDLCVLPDGRLLVLEREVYFDFSPFGFSNKIYLVDFDGATDVSGIDSLNGATYTKVTKTELWSGSFGNDMYEGICLGPELNDGSHSLLLISDGDTISSSGFSENVNESIYALKLSGVVPEPVTILMLLVGLGFIRTRQ